MRLSDIPPHVTDIKPPWFIQEFSKAYGPPGVPWDELAIVPRYHLDYWDGPLSGIIECHGQFFYCKAIYYLDRAYWAAWTLTPEELAIETNRHNLFNEYVGTHTEYTYDEEKGWVRRSLNEVKPQDSWKKFYKDTTIPKVDYKKVEEREIFGILNNPFDNW